MKLVKYKKIKELEIKQEELKEEFKAIISEPISVESINNVKSRGSEIIAESHSNSIILDILNWDNETKLSETALKFKNKWKTGNR